VARASPCTHATLHLSRFTAVHPGMHKPRPLPSPCFTEAKVEPFTAAAGMATHLHRLPAVEPLPLSSVAAFRTCPRTQPYMDRHGDTAPAHAPPPIAIAATRMSTTPHARLHAVTHGRAMHAAARASAHHLRSGPLTVVTTRRCTSQVPSDLHQTPTEAPLLFMLARHEPRTCAAMVPALA
jgi:hypothetical protein